MDESDGASAHFAGIAFTCLPYSWIIDSGTSSHICTSISQFISFLVIKKNIFVQLPDGSQAPVKHIGTIRCSPSLILTNVFHIPSFKFNLLSVSQLTKSSNCDVTFSSSECFFQDRASKTTIGRGSSRNGLFYLDLDFNFNYVLSFKHCNKFDLWHSRLGHPSSSRFDFIVKNFKDIVSNKDFICDVCPRAKQSRLPFPRSTAFTLHCF